MAEQAAPSTRPPSPAAPRGRECASPTKVTRKALTCRKVLVPAKDNASRTQIAHHAFLAQYPAPHRSKMPSFRHRNRACEVCRAFDFSKYLHQPIEQPWKIWQLLSSSRPSHRLGSWRQVLSRSQSCPFCRLVIECIEATVASTRGDFPNETDQIELSNRASWKMCILIFHFNSTLSKVYSNRADLEREARAIRRRRGGEEVQRLIVSWSGCKALGQIQQVVEGRPDEPHGKAFAGRVVHPDKLDWGLLRWWLRHCERYHGKLCEAAATSAALELPRNMRVIDVIRRRVVPYREGWEYVALTYVWGEGLMRRAMPKMKKDMAGGIGSEKGVALPESLPQTITDAIEAVKRLGYQYLWVDSLCIIQDDDMDRHHQLLFMDSVYVNASLTIAAASGDNADYGLPGMRRPRKFQQLREEISDVTLALPLPRFDELNMGDTLAWNTRGWTFQEKVLSRRLLIFTDFQVYFRCSNGVWSEDTATETTGRPGQLFRWGDDKLPHDYSTRRPYSLVDFLHYGSLKLAKVDARGSFANYAAVVEEYTQRTLTNVGDSLPAIEGVLRVLDPAPDAYVAGVCRRYFLEAILWHPKIGAPCEPAPKTGAPTWSWAGWSLSEGCEWLKRDIRNTRRLQHRPMFYWTDGTGPKHIALRRPDSGRIPRTPPRMAEWLQDSGAVLGLGVREGHLKVGQRLDGDSRYHTWPEAAHVFSLCLPGGDEIVGEIVTTGKGLWVAEHCDFIEISNGVELRFASEFISGRFLPTTTTRVWVPSTVREDGSGTPGHHEMQTIVDLMSTWRVANVMMVIKIDGVSYRRGVGKVLRNAWDQMETHKRFVYIG